MTSTRKPFQTQLRRSISEQLRDSTARAWDLLWKNVRERRLAGRCPRLGTLGVGGGADPVARPGPRPPPAGLHTGSRAPGWVGCAPSPPGGAGPQHARSVGVGSTGARAGLGAGTRCPGEACCRTAHLSCPCPAATHRRPSGPPRGLPLSQLCLFHEEHVHCVCGRESQEKTREHIPDPGRTDICGRDLGKDRWTPWVQVAAHAPCPAVGQALLEWRLQKRASRLGSPARESEEGKS